MTDYCDVLDWGEQQLLDLRATGFSYFKQGLYRRALIFFKALIAINPQSVYDLQMVAALHLQLGERERALELLDQALDLDPTHGPTLLNKAKALLLTGNLTEGFTLAESLIRVDSPRVRRMAEALLLAYR